MIEWLPGFERVNGTGSGHWASDNEDAPKIVLHTTEGPTVDGAISALRAKSAWSHFIVDPKTKRKVQAVSLAEASKSLRNRPGGVETNREARVYQIEIVGFAAKTQDLTAEELKWLGEEVVGPLAMATGTPLVAPVPFYGADCGWTLASVNAKQRLSPSDWDKAKGVFAHQHVPENDHWDAGKLNINAVLAAAKGVGLEELDLDEATVRRIFAEELKKVVNPDGKGNLLVRIRDSVALQQTRSEEIVKSIRKLVGK